MNMPRFTGEASLYQTRGQYRTGRHAIAARMISPIYPAVIDVGEETIPVHSCPPGYNDWGGKCYPILTEPPTGGGGSPGSGGEPGESGEGGGGDGGVPLDKDAPIPDLGNCSARQIQSKAAKPCHKKIDEDLNGGVKNPHYFECTGKRRGRVQYPKMQCCQQKGDDVIVCDDLN